MILSPGPSLLSGTGRLLLHEDMLSQPRTADIGHLEHSIPIALLHPWPQGSFGHHPIIRPPMPPRPWGKKREIEDSRVCTAGLRAGAKRGAKWMGATGTRKSGICLIFLLTFVCRYGILMGIVLGVLKGSARP